MDKYDIFKTAQNYAVELTKSEQFVEILDLKKQIDNNFKELLLEFKQVQEKYESIKEYGLYHPDLKRVQKQFQEVKQKLYSEPMVQQYFKLERKMQENLNDIAARLAESISSRFKEQECSKTCYKEDH